MMLHASNNLEICSPRFIHFGEAFIRKQFEERTTGIPVISQKRFERISPWSYQLPSVTGFSVEALSPSELSSLEYFQGSDYASTNSHRPQKNILSSNRMRLLLNLLSGRCLVFVSSILLIQLHTSLAVSQLPNANLADMTTEVAQLLSQPLDDDAVYRLIQIDESIAQASPAFATSNETKGRILKALASSQQEAGLTYVRSIFENEPERRGSTAAALAAATTLRPTDLQDWTFMVRSLPVVRGEDAVAVLNALQRFRNRANKGQWVRQVILIGLQLPSEQQVAATSLLRHWTGVPLKKSDAAAWTLEKYQVWFSKEYPDQPEAKLPIDSVERKWTMATLEVPVQNFVTTDEMKQLGERIYEKAGCQKCHRRGKVGETLGPDLTSLGWRRQRREILLATIFPSHELNEEYPTVTVSLKSGKTLTGMMSASSAETLAIVSSTGMRQEFLRTDVADIVNQRISNMPEGLLEPLTRDEIIALIAWLSSVDGIPRPHTDESP